MNISYFEKYQKYKLNYIRLKQNQFGSGFDYLKESKPLNYKYLIELINSEFRKTENLDVLEVGTGNALKSISLSKIFNSYDGLEPDEEMYKLSIKNCQKTNCKIEIFNTGIEDFQTNKKYDLILFANSFHFVEPKPTLEKLSDLLKEGGKVIIDEPKPEPYGWGLPKFNKDSNQFDPQLWERKKKRLLWIHNIITQKARLFDFTTREIDNKKKIFILTKKN